MAQKEKSFTKNLCIYSITGFSSQQRVWASGLTPAQPWSSRTVWLLCLQSLPEAAVDFLAIAQGFTRSFLPFRSFSVFCLFCHHQPHTFSSVYWLWVQAFPSDSKHNVLTDITKAHQFLQQPLTKAGLAFLFFLLMWGWVPADGSWPCRTWTDEQFSSSSGSGSSKHPAFFRDW